jgi:hypothetical protein
MPRMAIAVEEASLNFFIWVPINVITQKNLRAEAAMRRLRCLKI